MKYCWDYLVFEQIINAKYYIQLHATDVTNPMSMIQ